MKPTRAQLMTLYQTKGQGAFSPESVFGLFGFEPPTKQEIIEHIEQGKVERTQRLSTSKSELKEDCQTMYRRKLNEAKTYLHKKEIGRLIKGFDQKELMTNSFLKP